MQQFSYYLEKTGEYGEVIKSNHPIISASGLPGVKQNELVLFETGEVGHALSLYDTYIDILTFSQNKVKIGTRIIRTNQSLSVPVGEELLGNIINPLGIPLATKDLFLLPELKESRPIDVPPVGISKRARITKPLLTGTALVDLLIPLGKGQKQLILGDRKSGKSTFVRTTVINQVEEGAIAIYAAIGKTKAEIKYLEQFVKHHTKKERIVVVAASAFDSPGLIYLTPFTAMGLAEYFRDRGESCVVIMDDLLTHAKFYREFSLLAQTFPGRDSYPGDIFHVHARLLERAGNYKLSQDQEVSISILPIVETQEGDLTGYIVSNLMSITDGHIFFDANVFAKGRRPAINIPISVTRVGKQTQKKLLRDINRELYSFFAIYDRVENLSHFGSELTASVKSILDTGERIFAFLNQPEGLIVPDEVAVIIFGIVWLNLLEQKQVTLEAYRERLIQAYKNDQTKTFLRSLLNVDTLNPLLKQIKENSDKLFTL